MELIDESLFGFEVGMGYYYAYVPEHPFANASGKVRRHRYIASLSIGRWLRTEEHVHHLDGDKSNDAPSNLQILTAAEHGRIHKTGSTEEVIHNCGYCGVETTNLKYCGNICRAASQVTTDVTKKQLQSLIWDMPYTKVSKILSLSDKGVKKRAVALGCVLPPPRFHVKSTKEKERIRKEILHV